MSETEIQKQKRILVERLKGGLAALRIENPKLSEKQLLRKLLLGLSSTRKLMRQLGITPKDLGIKESNSRDSFTRKKIKRTVIRDSNGKLCVNSTEY